MPWVRVDLTAVGRARRPRGPRRGGPRPRRACAVRAQRGCPLSHAGRPGSCAPRRPAASRRRGRSWARASRPNPKGVRGDDPAEHAVRPRLRQGPPAARRVDPRPLVHDAVQQQAQNPSSALARRAGRPGVARQDPVAARRAAWAAASSPRSAPTARTRPGLDVQFEEAVGRGVAHVTAVRSPHAGRAGSPPPRGLRPTGTGRPRPRAGRHRPAGRRAGPLPRSRHQATAPSVGRRTPGATRDGRWTAPSGRPTIRAGRLPRSDPGPGAAVPPPAHGDSRSSVSPTGTPRPASQPSGPRRWCWT
jgi:hypothetical protein